MFKLKIKNITPICQIEESNSDTIFLKKRVILYDGIPVGIPYYSANGFRGLLRRKCGEKILEKALKKGIDIKPTDFHLMMSGGGGNFQTQPIETEIKVRELNPLISVFGTSLAIEGKLTLTDLLPIDPLIKIVEKDDNIYASSNLIRKEKLIKKDDILEHTKFGRFLKIEDIKEWEEYVEKEQAKRKEERKLEIDKEDKTKKTTIKYLFYREYIVPNTIFEGFIHKKLLDLNEIEYGMLLVGLENLTKEQLGSTKALGFGICEYQIYSDEGDLLIESKCNPNNLYLKDFSKFYTEKENKAIKEFEKWLDNLTADNIQISKYLKQTIPT